MVQYKLPYDGQSFQVGTIYGHQLETVKAKSLVAMQQMDKKAWSKSLTKRIKGTWPADRVMAKLTI